MSFSEIIKWLVGNINYSYTIVQSIKMCLWTGLASWTERERELLRKSVPLSIQHKNLMPCMWVLFGLLFLFSNFY